MGGTCECARVFVGVYKGRPKNDELINKEDAVASQGPKFPVRLSNAALLKSGPGHG